MEPPRIDYVGENYIMMHSFFGFFVVDTATMKLVSSIDLKQIDSSEIKVVITNPEKTEYKEYFVFQ